MKIERVYRHLLYSLIDKKAENRFTQAALSVDCHMSLSTVNYALAPLERLGSIEKRPLSFRVTSPKKILMYWASIRDLEADVIFRSSDPMPVEEVEMSVPPGTTLTAYSAFKLRFKEIPSEYTDVIAYGDVREFGRRFPGRAGGTNIVVLREDEDLTGFGQIVPICQMFVDLWNLGTWYAARYVERLEEIINGILA